jgi:hypothetical protein
MQRIVVIAKLKPDSHDAAAEIGLVRHGVYLGGSEVVFVFAGPEVEQQLSHLVNDPAASAAFSAWAPLLDGTPSAAHEVFYWEAP